jgi:hypothetical protein
MNLVRVIQDKNGGFAGIMVATLDPVYFRTLLNSINSDFLIRHETGLALHASA